MIMVDVDNRKYLVSKIDETVSIMIEWSVLQLSSPSSQNRSSLPKLVKAEFHGFRIHEKLHRAASTTPSRRWFLTTPITVSNCRIGFPWIPHEFRVHGIPLVLISRVIFYFVDRKEKIIEVLTIQ
jgi:hypothetical protein